MVSSSKVYTTGNIYPMLLKPEAISSLASPGVGVGVWQYLETFLIAVSQGWGATGQGWRWRPGLLLNISQCPWQPHNKIIHSKMLIVPQTRILFWINLGVWGSLSLDVFICCYSIC